MSSMQHRRQRKRIIWQTGSPQEPKDSELRVQPRSMWCSGAVFGCGGGGAKAEGEGAKAAFAAFVQWRPKGEGAKVAFAAFGQWRRKGEGAKAEFAAFAPVGMSIKRIILSFATIAMIHCQLHNQSWRASDLAS